MGTIKERTSSNGMVSYQAQVRLKGYPQQTQSFKRKTDAKKWISATEAAINEGRHFKTAEAKKHTYIEVADRYLKHIVPTKKDFRNVARHIEYWRSQIGSYALSDITPSLIIEARDNLRDGERSDSTVNRYMTSLSHSLNIAMNEWGWLEDTPIRKIKKLKEPRGRIRYLSEAERERLLKVSAHRG